MRVVKLNLNRIAMWLRALRDLAPAHGLDRTRRGRFIYSVIPCSNFALRNAGRLAKRGTGARSAVGLGAVEHKKDRRGDSDYSVTCSVLFTDLPVLDRRAAAGMQALRRCSVVSTTAE
jgi:hypothetical protein